MAIGKIALTIMTMLVIFIASGANVSAAFIGHFDTMSDCIRFLNTDAESICNGRTAAMVRCKYRLVMEDVPGAMAECTPLEFLLDLPNNAASGSLPSLPPLSSFVPWVTPSPYPLLFQNMNDCFGAIGTYLVPFLGQMWFDDVRCIRQSRNSSNPRAYLEWNHGGNRNAALPPPPPADFRPWVQSSLEFPTLHHCAKALATHIIPFMNEMTISGVWCSGQGRHAQGVATATLTWIGNDGVVIPPPPPDFNPCEAEPFFHPGLEFPTMNHCLRAIRTYLVPIRDVGFDTVQCVRYDPNRARTELRWNRWNNRNAPCEWNNQDTGGNNNNNNNNNNSNNNSNNWCDGWTGFDASQHTIVQMENCRRYRCTVGDFASGTNRTCMVRFTRPQMYFGPDGPNTPIENQCWTKGGQEYARCVRGR